MEDKKCGLLNLLSEENEHRFVYKSMSKEDLLELPKLISESIKEYNKKLGGMHGY